MWLMCHIIVLTNCRTKLKAWFKRKKEVKQTWKLQNWLQEKDRYSNSQSFFILERILSNLKTVLPRSLPFFPAKNFVHPTQILIDFFVLHKIFYRSLLPVNNNEEEELTKNLGSKSCKDIFYLSMLERACSRRRRSKVAWAHTKN